MSRRTFPFLNLFVSLILVVGFNFHYAADVVEALKYGIPVEYSYIDTGVESETPLPRDAYTDKLEDMGITLHPGTEVDPSNTDSIRSLNHCKSLVYSTLKSLPPEPVSHLKHLTLNLSDKGRRGLGGGDQIVLRCQNVEDEELVAVLVHEMGHVMDTGVMSGNLFGGLSEYMDGAAPIYKNDPSLDFYMISWVNHKQKKETADELDFVSGYAMTDPFEDFAETYAYYILHGDEFKTLTKYNESIKKKYAYMREFVFDGKEYLNENDTKVKVEVLHRNYDVTVLPYDMDEFFVA